MNAGARLVQYLYGIFSKYNEPNELRDWNYFAMFEDFKFSAFSDAVEADLVQFATHPRFTAIQLFARRAVELTGRVIRSHQCPEPFLIILDELQIAIDNRPTRLPTESLEIIEYNITDRRQWITPGLWLQPGYVLAIIRPDALKLELLDALTKCPKT